MPLHAGVSPYNKKEHIDHVRGALEQRKTRLLHGRTCRKPINDAHHRGIDRPEKRSAGGATPDAPVRRAARTARGIPPPSGILVPAIMPLARSWPHPGKQKRSRAQTDRR